MPVSGNTLSATESGHDAARKIAALLERASDLIEPYTRAVCPGCTHVCCKQRHGRFTETDLAYLCALGEDIAPHDPVRPLDGHCQFLGPTGCAKPRRHRAWKCTWFFCAPLLAALDAGPQRTARELTALTEEIMRLYEALKGRE